MKKVLIISDLFYPTNAIGALRPSKIAQKLLADGYLIDVYTRYIADAEQYCVHRYGFTQESIHVRKCNSTTNSKKIKTTQLKLIYRTILSLKNSQKMLNHFKNWLKDEKNNHYDVVFSTFGPISSLWCGLYYKEKNPSVKWICDFRDPIVVEFSPILIKPYFHYIQNKACKKADVIVTVSNGYLQRICKGKYADKAYMIPNGYDEEDFISGESVKNEKLTISYVGALYEGKRDLSPVFKAIAELIDENIIDKEKICFQFAGGEGNVILQQAGIHSVADIVSCLGKIPRKECLELQFNSDMLVLSTWNNKGEEGVFPGKFLEYMLIRKPIISVVDGNLGNSEVSQVMQEGRLGITYESVNKAADFPRLKEYIKKQYLRFISGEVLDFEPNSDVLERYNYKTIIKQLEEVMN